MPEYIYTMYMESVIATNLSRSCPSVQYDFSSETVLAIHWAVRLTEDDVSRVQYNRFMRDLPEKKMQDDFYAYTQTNGIVWRSADTVCAAAEKEMQLDSPIGQLLNRAEEQA